MLLGILLLVLYFLIIIVIDFSPFNNKQSNKINSIKYGSDENYFLSGKKMSTAVLLVSTAATNFSAFTILGLSGAGYRIGYAFYPVMAFGTGFMALGMYLVGAPLGELGRLRGYVSPADYVQDRYRNRKLTKIYSVVLILLTLPYLALQPMSAGIILESFFGVPYRIGVITCSLVVGLYTTRGGMRAVARTDLFQGVIMLVLAAAAYGAAVKHFGGFSEVHALTYRAVPELFSRSGRGPGINFSTLAGYIVLWFFADPMFPQLNQRFLAAKNVNTLNKTVSFYPVITMVLFFLTISVGVIGAGIFPGLDSGSTDRIWPMVTAEAVNPVMASVFMIAPLAAIMSSLDSQLLSLSSIITRDLMGKKDLKIGLIRIITGLIALSGLLIALFPPKNILDFINKSSFLGYAALAPLVFGGLYCKKLNFTGAFASILVGEMLTLFHGLGFISFGKIPAVFIICSASWLAMFAGSHLNNSSFFDNDIHVYSLSSKLPPAWMTVFVLLLIMGTDFLNYFIFDGGHVIFMGLPGWVFYQAALCLLLSGTFFIFFRYMQKKDKINNSETT